MDILQRVTEEFKLNPTHAKNVVELLDEGNTIPFIARYRKEMTGHIDDQLLREFADRLTYLRNLEKRKEDVKAAIEEQGKLTDEIVAALSAAETLTEVEDIYRPYKQKKKTRATVAIAKGLSPLADIILAQEEKTGTIEDLAAPYVDEEKEVKTVAEAIAGAKDIIAERYPGSFISSTYGNARIDYMYASPSMYARIVNALTVMDKWTTATQSPYVSNFYDPSDHRPILADFELKQ